MPQEEKIEERALWEADTGNSLGLDPEASPTKSTGSRRCRRVETGEVIPGIEEEAMDLGEAKKEVLLIKEGILAVIATCQSKVEKVRSMTEDLLTATKIGERINTRSVRKTSPELTERIGHQGSDQEILALTKNPYLVPRILTQPQ